MTPEQMETEFVTYFRIYKQFKNEMNLKDKEIVESIAQEVNMRLHNVKQSIKLAKKAFTFFKSFHNSFSVLD